MVPLLPLLRLRLVHAPERERGGGPLALRGARAVGQREEVDALAVRFPSRELAAVASTAGEGEPTPAVLVPVGVHLPAEDALAILVELLDQAGEFAVVPEARAPGAVAREVLGVSLDGVVDEGPHHAIPSRGESLERGLGHRPVFTIVILILILIIVVVVVRREVEGRRSNSPSYQAPSSSSRRMPVPCGRPSSSTSPSYRPAKSSWTRFRRRRRGGRGRLALHPKQGKVARPSVLGGGCYFPRRPHLRSERRRIGRRSPRGRRFRPQNQKGFTETQRTSPGSLTHGTDAEDAETSPCASSPLRRRSGSCKMDSKVARPSVLGRRLLFRQVVPRLRERETVGQLRAVMGVVKINEGVVTNTSIYS